MRIARFRADSDIQYGIVELAEDGGEQTDQVRVISGDPLAGAVNYTGAKYPLADVRLLSPVIPRSKVIGIGKNYAGHVAEFDGELPDEPLIFLKPNTSVIGPDESIIRPPETSELNYEGELAVVIGRIARRVPEERAAEVIFGYTCANDVTARDLQRADGQWSRAKGFDSFCPIGPWIATHLTLEEVGDLQIRTEVDGEIRQNESTSKMIFPVAQLVSFVSQFTTLLPGDVILTGTPQGVGEITPGQTVKVTIEKIGSLSNLVIDENELQAESETASD